MNHAHFVQSARTVASALIDNGIQADTYQVLNLTDTLLRNGAFPEPEPTDRRGYHTHDSRVAAALDSGIVMEAVRETKKINAIKEVRAITSCGLKEAKEAVEDHRVWGIWHY